MKLNGLGITQGVLVIVFANF